MLIFISHRGNLNGPNKKEENKIEYINHALKKNFDVDISTTKVRYNYTQNDIVFKKLSLVQVDSHRYFEVGILNPK